LNSFADIVGSGGCLPYCVSSNRRVVVAKNPPPSISEGRDDGGVYQTQKMNAGLRGFKMGEAVVA